METIKDVSKRPMAIDDESQIIIPTSEAHWLQLRLDDLTSTDVSALVGVSPYLTKRDLWERKKHRKIVEFVENERSEIGKSLEWAIAEAWSKKFGKKIRPMKEYLRLSNIKLGSSFDVYCETDEAIVEVKNIDGLVFKDNCIVDEDGSIEFAAHIELQAQHQLLVSGKKKLYIVALIGGNRLVVEERVPNENIFKFIKAEAEAFWLSIEKNIPPEFDYVRDADLIASLYNYAKPESVLDLSNDNTAIVLMASYKMAHEQMKSAEDRKKEIKSQLLIMAKDAEKIIGPWGSIAMGVIGPSVVKEHTRSGYRNFKPYFKKEKPQ